MISSDDAKQLALQHPIEKLAKSYAIGTPRVTVLDGWPETSYRKGTEPVWSVWVSGDHQLGASHCIIVSQQSGKILMDATVG